MSFIILTGPVHNRLSRSLASSHITNHVGRQFQEFHVVGLRADGRWTRRCICRHIVSMRAGEPLHKEPLHKVFIKSRASDRAAQGVITHASGWAGEHYARNEVFARS